MGRYSSAIFAGALLFFAFPTFSQTANPDDSGPAPVKVPTEVKSDGSYSDGIPIDLPSFRSLEPRMGLSYNSAFTGREGAEVWLGTGWYLSGLSSIERVAERGGAPTWNDAHDVFRLDGEDLMACADAGATNPWPAARAYPAGFKTDSPSASCAAGGNMSTRVESFLKITVAQEPYNGASIDYFIVTRKDGTQLRYESIGKLAGDTTSTYDPSYAAFYGRKWLLTEIRDTQASPNIVTISYAFETATNALAHRPTEVAYAGYSVKFFYTQTTVPLSSYMTGKAGLLGTQMSRLSSITVSDGATPIRAYGLSYSLSAQTSASLLTTVRTFGSDFSLTGSDITAGTELSGAITAAYSPDTLAFTAQTYTGKAIRSTAFSFDISGDGRDDVLQSTNMADPIGACSPGAVTAQYSWGSDYGYSFIGQPPAGFTTVARDNPSAGAYGTGPAFRGMSSLDPTIDKYYGFYTTFVQQGSYHGMPYGYWSSRAVTLDQAATATVLQNTNYNQMDTTPQPAPGGFPRGNFDRDFATEVVIGGAVKQILSSGLAGDGVVGAALLPTNVDINGDGRDERITTPTTSTLQTMSSQRRLDPAIGFVTQTSLNPFYAQPLPAGTVKSAFGDINGDGSDDLISWNIVTSGTDQVWVSLSDGVGFMPPARMTLSGAQLPNLVPGASGGFPWARMFVRDVNGDGLADLILDQGPNASFSNCGTYPTFVYLSNGDGFTVPVNGMPAIASLATIGDFDGNGLLDFASMGANASIKFGSGPVPNLLSSIIDANGGETRVEYTPSTIAGAGGQGNNRVPGVTQLVSAIETRNGMGSTDRTTFTYANSVYDYDNRRTLGFQTVTAQLPAIAGEATGPVVTTTYENASFWMHGAVKSEVVSVGGTTTYRATYNTWTASGGPNGPFDFEKTSERTFIAHGSASVETKRDLTYSPYGEPLQITDYGVTVGGVDQAAGDNTVTVIDYEPNLTAYIVDKPKFRRIQSGTVSSWTDKTTWLMSEFYRYDGNAQYFDPPTRGNLTDFRVWKGNTTNLNQRSIRSFTYDAWGNALTERDARGAVAATPYDVATHTYDTAKHLFRLTSANALGQTSTTVWNTACQQPLSVADANGLTTTFAYDVHCRETRKDLPSTQYEITRYVGFGTPGSQYVEKETKSGSTTAGSTLRIAQSWFDGNGRVYKVTKPGGTSALSASIVELRGYDGRGNLSWKSIPLSWAAASGNTATASQRETYTYDPLDRLVQTTYADGTYDMRAYTTGSFDLVGTTLTYPGVQSTNADCYDAAAANTVCGSVTEFFDPAGRKVRELRVDTAATDVTGLTTQDRVTQFKYDLLGQLKTVIDPEGLTFSYTYDIDGNRVQASDPGLGTWTMAYDDNGNLTTQTDAKAQTITFVYDAMNRVTLKTVGAGTTRVDTAYTYDTVAAGYYNKGRVTQMAASIGGAAAYHTIQLDYDPFGSAKRTRNTLDGKTYTFDREFRVDGSLKRVSLPQTPGATTAAWLPDYTQDAAGRSLSWTGYVTSTTYDLWGNATQINYATGASAAMTFSPTRGWMLTVDGTEKSGSTNQKLFRNAYTRSASGRIQAQDTAFTIETTTYDKESSVGYSYDYAGRLLAATNTQGIAGWSQSFSYDAAGRMRNNSLVGAYAYGSRHAPSTVTPAGQAAQAMTYDGNGNMTQGLDGKVMTYDGENRPESVIFAGVKTCYIYGADGARLKKISNVAAGAACPAAPLASQPVTLYLGPVEIRNYGQGNAEALLIYAHPSVRIQKTKNAGGAVVTTVTALYTDALGSVRAMTGAGGAKTHRSVYRPYGEEQTATFNLTALDETKGFIGERMDAEAGLQYLNARYYDPKLALFLQPDWWEVMRSGVGTNRYGYAGGDPVNGRDPTGHSFGGGNGHERPDSGPGTTTGGTSFSNGAGLYDRHERGAWGWKNGEYGYWYKNHFGKTPQDATQKFISDISTPSAYPSKIAAMGISNIQFVMGDLRFTSDVQGLAEFLEQNGFQSINGIIVTADGVRKMVETHGWFSYSPSGKSKFFLDLSNPTSMNDFVENMVRGTNALSNGYRFAYDRYSEVGVVVSFNRDIGLTGYYRGNLPAVTNAARFDMRYDPLSGVFSIVNGFPVPR